MPYRHSQEGKTAIERREELKLWCAIVAILTVLVGLAADPANALIVAARLLAVGSLIAATNTIGRVLWNAHDLINHVSKKFLFLDIFSLKTIVSLSIDEFRARHHFG